MEQGLYWKAGHEPMLEYVVEKYDPDLLLAGMPTTDEFQHQFLGLVSPKLPNGAPNPAYDDVDLNRVKDGRIDAREGFIRTAYMEADEILTKARELMDDDDGNRGKGKGRGKPVDVTTFVGSDHGFAPQFLAIDASLPLVELGLLSRPQTSNCRPATGETIGKAKACWAGGTVQIYLNLVGRDPAGGGFQQVAAGDLAATVAAIKAKYLSLTDPNDWTGDGAAEGWKMIDRVFTKAEARYIPNGPGSRPTWRIRPGPATWSRSRSRRTSTTRRRRARSSRRRTSSASTATCPTSRTSTRTSTCGRRSWRAARGSRRAR